MEFTKKCARILQAVFGWFLIVQGGLWGLGAGITAFAALFGALEQDSFAVRMLIFGISIVMAIGFFTILWLGIRLKNSGRIDKSEIKENVPQSAPVKAADQPIQPKKTPTKTLDQAKEQRIAAERAAQTEMKKIYQEFLDGDGRLPEGFSEKYNGTILSGYILHKTPFEEYLGEIGMTIDALHDSTGISDWIYFDGRIEINAAIEMITDWARRHREMNTHLRKRKVGFRVLSLYCEHKIMVVMENGDAFRNVTEKSIASCKAEQISFCTILSECELYDLIEHKAKTIEYTTYPGYHDETYADWWLKDSLLKQDEHQPLKQPEKHNGAKAAKKSNPKKNMNHEKKIQKENPFERAKHPYEVAGAKWASQYEEECNNFLFLSDAHLAGELEWGQWEYFAVNTETWQPFYIISQYDGALVAKTWYHVKEDVDWEEVETYGDPVCKCQLADQPKGKWKDMVVKTKKSSNSFRIWWRSSRQYNEDVELQVKENAFLLIHYPGNSSHSPKERELPLSISQDKAAFHNAVSEFGIHKEYIIQMLWDFCLKMSKSKHTSTAKAKSGVGENEVRSVKKWVNILGKPGDHGDVLRVGFGAGKCYLKITNDGFPYGNGGGFICEIPDDVVRGKRLDARKFEKFFRSVYPCGEIPDYSDPIWINKPTLDRPV